MMTTFDKQQQTKQIDAAMALHISTLHDAAFDGLGALLNILIGLFSLLHALVRVSYALVGLATWTLGVWIISLQSFHAWCVSKSSTSPFRKEDQADE